MAGACKPPRQRFNAETIQLKPALGVESSGLRRFLGGQAVWEMECRRRDGSLRHLVYVHVRVVQGHGLLNAFSTFSTVLS